MNGDAARDKLAAALVARNIWPGAAERYAEILLPVVREIAWGEVAPLLAKLRAVEELADQLQEDDVAWPIAGTYAEAFRRALDDA